MPHPATLFEGKRVTSRKTKTCPDKRLAKRTLSVQVDRLPRHALPIHTNAWPTVCVGAMSARPSRLKSATEECRMLALGWATKKSPA
ncbi:MAG: hypothetical protein HOB00_14085 [Verrucomicrobia bacterium]|nr:hypothetical protein [Verrucomicrobiota bacterium]